MEYRRAPGAVDSRPPLGDATKRVTNTSPIDNRGGRNDQNVFNLSYPKQSMRISKDSDAIFPPTNLDAVNRQENYPAAARAVSMASKPTNTKHQMALDPREMEAKRVSQFSNLSSTASTTRQLKTHIGPWQLGKTLSKGSSARVRLARHRVTHQLAAIKIVTKDSTKITQAGSLANLDRLYDDNSKQTTIEGLRRMPVAIEREVAILKLIEHPNILKLYDIWENRSEIYLVTEYVEKGDMFDFINWQGRMREEEAIYYFRQIMSAMEYIHSFNICHRDLKPENILLKSDGTVKIADFGMAALHQGPSHPLKTACGSPHYAAPELLRNQCYKGPEVDIWSMGVILFAMLAGRLPFDEPNIHIMLAKAKRGDYQMSKSLSPEAQDFVRKILVVNPKHRITMEQMWKTPLMKKYDYLNEFILENKTMPTRPDFNIEAIPEDAIDPQILRQLKSLWHASTEKEIQSRLMEEQPNEQKIFYWLLHNYRETQLEDYNNDLPVSRSDFHHLKPPNWGKRISTCQFTQPRRKGQHQRVVSRFTVISNMSEAPPESEFGTVRSYDPYNASRVLHPSQASHAKIVIHRPTSAETTPMIRSSRSSVHQRRRKNSQRTYKSDSVGRMRSPVGSASSIHSSRFGSATPRVRANGRHRRAVDFSNIRKRPGKSGTWKTADQPHSQGGSGSVPPVSNNQQVEESSVCRETHSNAAQSAQDAGKPREDSLIWNDELRKLSHSIAKDCDEAFQSSLLVSESEGAFCENGRQSTLFSLTFGTPSTRLLSSTPASNSKIARTDSRPWDDRPLPPVPVEELLSPPSSSARPTRAIYPTIAPLNIAKKSRVAPDSQAAAMDDRRIVSAPVSNNQPRGARPLASICESSIAGEAAKPRTVSAPIEKYADLPTPHNDHKGLEYLSRAENTIRIVQSPSAVAREISVMKLATPKPLSIRKPHSQAKSGAGSVRAMDSHRQPVTPTQEPPKPRVSSQNEDARLCQPQNSESSATSKRKMASWFKRSSKQEAENVTKPNVDDLKTAGLQVQSKTARPSSMQNLTATAPTALHRAGSQQSQNDGDPISSSKKKHFSLSFWKGSKNEPRMSLGDIDHQVATKPELDYKAGRAQDRAKAGHTAGKSASRANGLWQQEARETAGRQIEVHQNWLARLFRVKPATRNICFSISKRRARQEVAILLREWRQYGMKDVQVDKERNIVFARVSRKNYLNIKEVSFAAEIMTVIEHGRRSHLSIVRFTQEKGAASSFHQVVDTMSAIFSKRSLLVSDKRKAKMMVKTLNS